MRSPLPVSRSSATRSKTSIVRAHVSDGRRNVYGDAHGHAMPALRRDVWGDAAASPIVWGPYWSIRGGVGSDGGIYSQHTAVERSPGDPTHLDLRRYGRDHVVRESWIPFSGFVL